MKNYIMSVDESVMQQVISFLKLIPKDKLQIHSFPAVDIPEVTDEEQAEIEKALQNPECSEFVVRRKIDL
jgi:hypothetical protein